MNLGFLLYLACPIGMGLMMWLMMRGNKAPQAQAPPAPLDITTLRENLHSLETQQKVIQTQMQRLIDEDAALRKDGPTDHDTPIRGS